MRAIKAGKPKTKRLIVFENAIICIILFVTYLGEYIMKIRFTFLIILSLLLSNICFSQSGWVSKFFNNTHTFTKILQRDSTNYIALCSDSKYYCKSSDAGNNWLCFQDYAFDSIYSYFDGQFVNAQTGWIVGLNSQFYDGAIFKTTNGGFNWIRQNSGFTNSGYYCLCFLDANTGWIGASGGTIGQLLKTTNGGTNWTIQDFPGAFQIRSVKFFNNNTGWISGPSGLLDRTTDGGITWLQKTVNNIPCSNSQYRNLFALNATECWVLVTCSPNYTLVYSHLFKTVDAGDNWNLMYSYTDSLNTNSHSFWYVNFINSTTGFSNGAFNFIIRTTNSGLIWNRIDVGSGGAYPIISSLLPINSNEIFAGGGFSGEGSSFYDPYNYILKSTNTGLNWIFKTYNWEYNFSRIVFPDINTGFVISDTGKIFKTSNNGSNWNLIFNNNNYRLKEIFFVNNSTGCIVANPTFYNYGRILRTTNSGINWTEAFNSPDLPIYSIKFTDQQNGWASCDSNRLLKTSNAGLNWNLINLSSDTTYDILCISFINNSTGWLLGHYFYPSYPSGYEINTIWKTSNSGINWSNIYDSLGFCYNYHIKFIDNFNGYKLSQYPYRLQKTTNGGINWFNLNVILTPFCLDFINQNTGWVGGRSGQATAVIYKTTNSGFTWTLQFSNPKSTIVNSVFALDSNNAWLCGDYSSIFTTTNGGGIIGINNINTQLPKSFSLYQNYPNPFNPVTRIKFDIPKSSNVKLVIYDVLGREVEILFNESKKPGTYEVNWDGSKYASGVYFYKLITDEFVETKKMVLLK
jgi:photosystem II stability/assembly factor-like uncharacterized protein